MNEFFVFTLIFNICGTEKHFLDSIFTQVTESCDILRNYIPVATFDSSSSYQPDGLSGVFLGCTDDYIKVCFVSPVSSIDIYLCTISCSSEIKTQLHNTYSCVHIL